MLNNTFDIIEALKLSGIKVKHAVSAAVTIIGFLTG